VISGEIQNSDDIAKLKSVCLELARAIDTVYAQRSKDFDDLAAMMRTGLKIALGFAAASVVVLLLGWVAAGRVTRQFGQKISPG
jgi:hypothetical protein